MDELVCRNHCTKLLRFSCHIIYRILISTRTSKAICHQRYDCIWCGSPTCQVTSNWINASCCLPMRCFKVPHRLGVDLQKRWNLLTSWKNYFTVIHGICIISTSEVKFVHQQSLYATFRNTSARVLGSGASSRGQDLWWAKPWKSLMHPEIHESISIPQTTELSPSVTPCRY